MKRFQLLQKVNPEGLYGTIQAALPHFERNEWKGRIIVVSPPIYSRFFRGKTAYAMGKVGMSVLTKGLAMDFERQGRENMAITSLWPAVVCDLSILMVFSYIYFVCSDEKALQSAATQRHAEDARNLRKPNIFSDAILALLEAPVARVNRQLELDEDFQAYGRVTDFIRKSQIYLIYLMNLIFT
jgi:NAD(P)-dependent dehydrogenase (short-subunit alcohol dehydrogenase family)